MYFLQETPTTKKPKTPTFMSTSTPTSTSQTSSSDAGSTIEIFPTTENESVDFSSHFFTELSDVTIEKIPPHLRGAAPGKPVEEKPGKRDSKPQLEVRAEAEDHKVGVVHDVDDFVAPETSSNQDQVLNLQVLEPVTGSGLKDDDLHADDHNTTQKNEVNLNRLN